MMGGAHTGSSGTEQGKEGRNEIWAGQRSWFGLWEKMQARETVIFLVSTSMPPSRGAVCLNVGGRLLAIPHAAVPRGAVGIAARRRRCPGLPRFDGSRKRMVLVQHPNPHHDLGEGEGRAGQGWVGREQAQGAEAAATPSAFASPWAGAAAGCTEAPAAPVARGRRLGSSANLRIAAQHSTCPSSHKQPKAAQTPPRSHLERIQ